MNALHSAAPGTVVITGASAGVGRAIVHEFARSHWRIALIARDAAALEEVRREVEELGGSAIALPTDVANADAVFAAADRTEEAFGQIDVWINDAMVTVFSPVWQITPEEFRRVTEVTYLGFVHGTMAALRKMRPVKHGHIIQIGSALAYRGIPLQSAYCGAKHAIRGFTDSLRTELIHENSRIQLTMMELPAVNTPQFDWARTHMAHRPRPVAPVVEPEVIGRAVFDIVRAPRREVWIGWSTLQVILGNMLMPAFLDRYLAQVAVKGQHTPERVTPDRQDNLMTPVREYHRTRGSFGREARRHAVSFDGPAARIVPIVASGVALLLGGWLASRTRERDPHLRRGPRRHYRTY